MPLRHDRPIGELASELDEVARAASDLLEIFQRGLNAPLPSSFPKNQLIDICFTLVSLPNGTAEGCRAVLEYARSRLPAIRQEHISIELDSHSEQEQLLTRGAIVDQKLTFLISSVVTALNAYRRLANDEDENDDITTESGLSLPAATVHNAVEKSNELDGVLGSANDVVRNTLHGNSENTDALQRQIEDARGVNRVGSAELRMPKVIPSWLRRPISALKKYPDLIRSTASGIRISAYAIEGGYEILDNFQRQVVKQIFETTRETTELFEKIASDLEKRQQQGTQSVDRLDVEHDEPRNKRIFVPQSSPINAVKALETIISRPGLERKTLDSTVGRNEMRDLLSLGVIVRRNGKIYAAEEALVDTELILRRAVHSMPIMKKARALIIDNPEVTSRELADSVGTIVGKHWEKDSTRQRHGAAIRRWALWLEPYLIDPTSSGDAAGRVASAVSESTRKGRPGALTPVMERKLRKLVRAGTATADIAATLKVSKQTVTVWRRRLGV